MAFDHPNALLKYVPAHIGKRIITTQSLRWRSPQLFNAPFDLNYDSKLSFNHQSLKQALLKNLTSMIFGRDVPRSVVVDHPVPKLIRRWRTEERFSSEEEVEESLELILDNMIDRQQGETNIIMNAWLDLVKHLRMCTFSEKADYLPYWETHADEHRGIAIKFDPKNEDYFSPMRKMNYDISRPQITSLKQQVDILTGQAADLNTEELINNFFVQAKEQSLAKEWRCYKILDEDNFYEEMENHLCDDEENYSKWFQDICFEKDDLSAVYFGAKVNEHEKTEIIELLHESYGNKIKLFQAQLSVERFELEFETLAMEDYLPQASEISEVASGPEGIDEIPAEGDVAESEFEEPGSGLSEPLHRKESSSSPSNNPL